MRLRSAGVPLALATPMAAAGCAGGEIGPGGSGDGGGGGAGRSTRARPARTPSGALPGTAVLAHADLPIPPGRNALWCATFGLAWDALGRSPGGGPLRLEPPAADAVAAALRARPFPAAALDPACYFVHAGPSGGTAPAAIAAELRRRFATSPLDMGPLPPDGAVACAFLRKSLPFARRFASLDRDAPFHGGTRAVAWFGRDAASGDEAGGRAMDQVVVRAGSAGAAEGPPDSFVLEFAVAGGRDRLFLARGAAATTLREGWDRVAAVMGAAPVHRLTPRDRLLVPGIDFDVDHRFAELVGARVVGGAGTGGSIAEARQTVLFGLDAEGARLESRAVAVFKAEDASPPRTYAFNGPFLVALVEAGATEPYLLLHVENDELLAAATR